MASLLAVIGCAVVFGSTDGPRWTDASQHLLPLAATNGRTMDLELGDFDGDGAADLVVATEYGQNVVLFRRGEQFEYQVGALPQTRRGDSEDIAIADLDGDGDLDLVFASEDTVQNELYLNDGRGVFTDVSERLPGLLPSNAIAAGDVDGDGDVDLVFGNAGLNQVLINDGRGFFADDSDARLPQVEDVTQDVELVDIDGDGDLDLLVGNEGPNRILINDGDGRYIDETERRFSGGLPDETREIDAGDVDGDGDLDVLCANVGWTTQGRAQNRLLINDGSGVFVDETEQRLPRGDEFAVDADLVDLDGDGDLDIAIARVGQGLNRPIVVQINDGAGVFATLDGEALPAQLQGQGIDVEAMDLDGDGRVDLIIANAAGPDLVLLAAPTAR